MSVYYPLCISGSVSTPAAGITERLHERAVGDVIPLPSACPQQLSLNVGVTDMSGEIPPDAAEVCATQSGPFLLVHELQHLPAIAECQ